MPGYVLKNKDKSVKPMIVDVPEHQIDDFVAQWAGQGWSLDAKADPVAAAREAATTPTNPTEK